MTKIPVKLVNRFFLLLICLIIILTTTIKININKFKLKKVNPKTFILSITKEQAIRNGSFKEFDIFFRDSRFGFDNLNYDKVIEIRHILPIRARYKTKDWIITRDLSIYLLMNFFTSRELFRIVLKTFKSTIVTKKLIDKSELKLIKKVNFDRQIWESFIQKSNSQINLITTQSQLGEMPIYFILESNRVVRHMLWYSVNSLPIQKRNEPKINLYLGNLICKNIDCHYVWNVDQEQELLLYGVKKCKIVKSILFYPHGIDYKKRQKVITFFDITPFENANTIYTEEFSIDLLKSILWAVDEVNSKNGVAIKIRIKPKRFNTKYHSKKYIGYLNSLESQNKIDILDWRTNLYDCISESMGIVATPFSSPVAIGKELAVPSTYFLNDDGNWDLSSCKESESLLRNLVDLKNWLQVTLDQFEKSV